MWSEVGSADSAGRSLKVDLAPDATTKLRLFVAAPAAGDEHSAVRRWSPSRPMAPPAAARPGRRRTI